MIIVELFQEKTNFGNVWVPDWSLTEHVESLENRWENYFGESSKIVIVIRCDWILT